MAGRGKTLGSRVAKKATFRSSKAGLQFPVGRIARFLKNGKFCIYTHLPRESLLTGEIRIAGTTPSLDSRFGGEIP
ncbi:hypothetical protein F2Q70_00032398 [Brassica cretica]|uniref:Uncharacterized protein n=1 Tax=Brassica cretica TaxID=69181 RepID=A0A8S9FR68_BRACR|nr:hypothetical protein F2Q70_00032398 [Brassica cretica]KAF2549881.1 hypothetical protein F2Q68_00036781 [Brassica cretica]